MTVDRRRTLAALAGLVLGLFGVLLAGAPASAHAALVASDPGSNTIVPDAPNKITLTFSESVQLISGKIQVLAPDGSRADQGDPTATGSTVTIPLRTGGARGTYLLSYRVVSADSHPVSGTLVYSVGATSTPPTASDDSAAQATDPVVRALIPVGKYVGYAGMVLLLGPVLVLALLWPHRLSRVAPARLVWTGIGLVLGSTLLALWLQAPYTTGSGLFQVSLADLQDVLGSTFGAVMLVRLGVVVAAAFLLRPLLRGTGSKADLALLGVLGVAAIATWPLTGHPTASPVAGVSVVVDAVHLAAMSVWMGGLIMLVGFLLRHANDRELGAILPIWSRWAATAVAALVVAGVVQSLIEVSSFEGFLTSTYGRLILVKAALTACVVAVAAWSRKLVKDRTAAAGPTGPTKLRRLVLGELAITAVILGVAAALVQIPPPRTAEAAETGATSTTVSQTVADDRVSLQADIFPASVGNNSLHLYAYTPDNQPLTVVEWKATAALPAKNIEPIEIPLLRITDFHAVGDIALPMAGEWTFKFTVRTSDIDQSNLTLTANIQ